MVEFELRNQPQEYQTRSFAAKMGRFVVTVQKVDPPNGIATPNKRVAVTVKITVDT